MNVLYLCSDEHNPALMGDHPVVNTPHMDRLRDESLNCTKAYVASPVCAPTRQSWLTGLHAAEHGQLGNQYAFDTRIPTVVESFKGAGYRTACLGKLHTWAPEVDGMMGFDRILNENSGDAWKEVRQTWRISRETPEFDTDDAKLFAAMPFGERFSGRVRPDVGSCSSWLLAQEARTELQTAGDKPFFLYVGFRLPHYPFDLPRDWYYRFDPAEMPGAFGPDSAASPGTRFQARKRGWDKLTAEHHRLLQARYYAAIEYTDHLVGEVLAELDAQGLRENTLVIYTSDHGDMAGERGVWLKHTMFDASARKPLFLRMPGLRAGSFDHLISEVDVLKTVAGLVGVAHDHGSGRDLSAALLSGAEARTTAFAADYLQEDGGVGMTMTRGRRFKLTHYREPSFQQTAVELFDMEQDPAESHDLSTDPLYKPVVDELLHREQSWLDGLEQPEFPIALRA